jgi:DNA mismatch endonuclease (patch repair protein)
MARKPSLVSPPASSPAVKAVMRANKKRDTRPELVVRRLLHALGYRYRLHARNLPGNPDIVFPSRRCVIFVHGCFWHQHQHSSCPLRSHPRSNLSYWKPKLFRNRLRDASNQGRIAQIGWRTFVVWECELQHIRSLEKRLVRFLASK